MINRPVADVLQDQYSSVWSIPAENYKVDDPKQFFRTSVQEEPEEILFKVKFTKDKVIKAIEKLNRKAASWPDGVDNNIIYKLREFLAEPLANIFQK